MFNNIGNKIKTYAEIVAWIGILASIVAGVAMIVAEGTIQAILLGLLTCIIGSLVSWISSFVLYGFGQLIVNTDILVGKLSSDDKKTPETEVEYEVSGRYECEYVTWEDKISALSTNELNDRINSEDWQDDYKALCKKELAKRKQ